MATSHNYCLVLFPDHDDNDDDNDDDDDDDANDVDHLGGPQLKALLPSNEILLSVRGTPAGQTIILLKEFSSQKF